MLGMAAGDQSEIDLGHRVELLEVHEVPYQPTAHSKACSGPADLRLIPQTGSLDRTPARSSSSPFHPGDDPGPYAA